MGKQIINGDVEITGQLLKGDLKALYHLGAYDSVDTSNADYDVITRGTGYLVINAENITSVGEGAGNHITFGLTNLKTPMVDTSGPFGGTIGVSSNGYNVARVSGYWVGDLTIALTGDDYAVIGNDSLSTVADFQALCPIYIEYKLSSTYTEKVLKNQPISQLDQNGENWLRGEYEKTLNLLQEKISQSDVWAIKLGTAYLENGKTYSLSLSKDVAGSMLYAGDYNFFTSYNFYRRGSFTFNGTTGNYELTLRGTYPSSSGYAPTWAMLNLGSTAYPYQPYNGKVMHAIDVEGVKLWENGDPNTSFSPNAVSLPTLPNYSRVLFVFKLNLTSSFASQTMLVLKETGKYAFLSLIGSGGDRWERNAHFESATTIRFYHGTKDGVEDDIAIIPLAIYGIK